MITSDTRLDPRGLGTAGLGPAALALIGLLASIESGARLPAVASRLAAPSLGSPARHLDLRVAEWREFLVEGTADVLFLGDSTVGAAIDVERFDARVERLTGVRPRSFLMRISGLDVETAALLARALDTRDTAALMVYGLAGGKLSTDEHPGVMRRIRRSAWLRQRLGKPSLEGWLVDHSRALGYWLHYRQWLRPGAWERIRGSDDARDDERAAAPRRGRFLGADDVRRKYGPLHVSPRATIALARLAAEQGAGRVAFVEVPVRPQVVEALGHPEYETAMRIVEGVASRTGAAFWRPPTDRIAVRESDWRDIRHVNSEASRRFSEWLADRVVAAARDGSLTLPGVARDR